MNDFRQQYELYLKAVAKANELNKAVVFEALAAACLTRVTVEFDGEGDSGQINGIAAHAGEAPAELPSTALPLHQATHGGSDLRTGEATLRDAIEPLCYDYLTQCHGVWGNNARAYRTFEFDVPSRPVHRDIDERFTDTTTSPHVFLGRLTWPIRIPIRCPASANGAARSRIIF